MCFDGKSIRSQNRSKTRDRALPVYTKDGNKRFAKSAIYTKELQRCGVVLTPIIMTVCSRTMLSLIPLQQYKPAKPIEISIEEFARYYLAKDFIYKSNSSGEGKWQSSTCTFKQTQVRSEETRDLRRPPGRRIKPSINSLTASIKPVSRVSAAMTNKECRFLLKVQAMCFKSVHVRWPFVPP